MSRVDHGLDTRMDQLEFEAMVDRLKWRMANIEMVMDWIRADPERYRAYDQRWWKLSAQHQGLLDAWEELARFHFGEPPL